MAWPISVAGDGDLYLAKNRLSSTLSAGIGAGDTTIPLADASAFPAVGIVTIGAERIKYTGVSVNDLTGCTRGFDGTGASAASSGTLVRHNIVAQHHNAVKDEVIAIETSLDLTASRAVVTSASGRVAASATTAAEVGYLSGVTSAIQTQIGDKVAKAGDVMSGNLDMDGNSLILGNTSNTFVKLNGAAIQMQSYAGGATDLESAGELYIFNTAVGGLNIGLTSSGDIALNTPAGQAVTLAQARLRVQAGTAALPSITHGTDTNTGFYWSGSDSIIASTAGSNLLTLDGNVNVNKGQVLAQTGSVGTPAYSFSGVATAGLSVHGSGTGYPYLSSGSTVLTTFKATPNYNGDTVGSLLVNMGAPSFGSADLICAFSEAVGLRNTNTDHAGNGAVGFTIFGNREFTARGATLNLESTQNQGAGGGASINLSGRVNNSGDESRIFAKVRGAKRSSTNAEAIGQCRIYAANAGTLTEGVRVDYDGKVGVFPQGSHPHSVLTVGGSFAVAFTSISTNTTLNDSHCVVSVDATSGNVTVTLPAASGIAGRQYFIKKVDSSANTVVIDGNASETIDGATTVTISTQWQSYTIVSNGTNWLII
jgi:hypothetical protein